MDNVHHRVWEQPVVVRPWRPLATYALLGTMVGVYLLEQVVYGIDTDLFQTLFTIGADWPTHPWSPFTSTLSHGSLGHLFFNGLMFFFFGPNLERLLGRRAFVVLFLLAGAASGILQAELSAAFGAGLRALGASGALMMLFGALMVLFPNNTLLIYGILPVRFWIAGIAFAAIDALGALGPTDGVGHFAHLGGLAIGLALGLGLRQNPDIGGRLRRNQYAMR